MNSIINEHFTDIFFNHSQWTLANEVCWVMKKLSNSALKSSPKWLQKRTKRLRCMTRPGVSKLRPTGKMRPTIQLLLARIKSEDTFVYHISLYILSIFCKRWTKFSIWLVQSTASQLPSRAIFWLHIRRRARNPHRINASLCGLARCLLQCIWPILQKVWKPLD